MTEEMDGMDGMEGMQGMAERDVTEEKERE